MGTDGPGGAYVHFDGVKYALRDHPDILHVFHLLPCGLGLVCDAGEPQTALRCAAGGACFDSRFDWVRNETRTSPGSYEQVLHLYEAMVAAVKSGRHDAWSK